MSPIAPSREAKRASRSTLVAEQGRRARHRADTEVKLQRLVAAIAAGADVPAVRAEIQSLEAQRLRLAAEQEAAEDLTVVQMQPHLTETHTRCVAEIAALLAEPIEDQDGEEARQTLHRLLRPLIERILLHLAAAKRRFDIEMDGNLTRIMGRSAPVTPQRGVTVASPTGFEPVFSP